MDNKNEQKVINQETRTKVEMRTGSNPLFHI